MVETEVEMGPNGGAKYGCALAPQDVLNYVGGSIKHKSWTFVQSIPVETTVYYSSVQCGVILDTSNSFLGLSRTF